MFDPTKHKVLLIQILKDIYSDTTLRTILGFKGGTAALLFYDLPRLSVDLDFDLLDPNKKAVAFSRVKNILASHGSVRDATEKRYTLFYLLSYQIGKQSVKIEISKRKSGGRFELKNYLGIPMLVMKQEDMMAAKLSALLTRNKFAMRDVFDVWFFSKNNWSINEQLLQEKTNLTLKLALEKAIDIVSSLNKNQLLQGLGELLDSKQKDWVKEKLQAETIFYLRLAQGKDAPPDTLRAIPTAKSYQG